jgi:hypothetical protein
VVAKLYQDHIPSPQLFVGVSDGTGLYNTGGHPAGQPGFGHHYKSLFLRWLSRCVLAISHPPAVLVFIFCRHSSVDGKDNQQRRH